MSMVTHFIPQFSEGQIFLTPTASQPQDIVVAQNGAAGQVLTVPLTTSLAPVQTIQLETKQDPQLEREKQEIYRHPLFPLMALMFERCEQASTSPDFSGMDNFDADIQAFIRHQEKENKGLLVEDDQLNNLMIKAIQVLRIHLMEMEKVSDLCKDFCTRYTNCLKGKLQSENLLRTESDYDQSMFDEPPSEVSKPVNPVVSSPGNVIVQQSFQTSLVPSLGPGQIMSGGTVYQMVQTAQGLVAHPVQLQSSITSTPIIHGGTPLSQLCVPAQPVLSPSSANNSIINSLGGAGGFDSDDDDSGKKKNKRGVLPKTSTQIMKSWLFQHIVHPYPTEDEKRQIASQTNLTLLQVNNWFINARRRILQPMLDAGNPEQSKTKKAKPQSKPSQRFWPFTTSNSDSSTNASSDVKSEGTPPLPVSLVENSGQAFILPPGAFVTSHSRELTFTDGSSEAVFNQATDMSVSNAAVYNQATDMSVSSEAVFNQTTDMSVSSPTPSANEKDNNSDNNNNSQNTDNDLSENEEPT